MIKNKLSIVISAFLVSCGTFNYPNSRDASSIAPIIATELLQFMKNYPAAISYVNLINGFRQ